MRMQHPRAYLGGASTLSASLALVESAAQVDVGRVRMGDVLVCRIWSLSRRHSRSKVHVAREVLNRV
jgi:hypothetical protein